MIPRIFEGQPCIIVAGGPSLIGFDFSRLKGRNVIAINRAHEFIPDATVLWWTDWLFWCRHKEALLAHAAPWKATSTFDYPEDQLPPVHRYVFTGLKGFDPRPGFLRHGNNSTYAAMHLAAHLGSSLEILLGVDMQHGPKTKEQRKGASHFHSGHGWTHDEKSLKELMLPYFETLAPGLAERGVAVLNASEHSALRVWPRCSIEQGLAAYDRAALCGKGLHVSPCLAGSGNHRTGPPGL